MTMLEIAHTVAARHNISVDDLRLRRNKEALREAIVLTREATGYSYERISRFYTGERSLARKVCHRHQERMGA